MRDDKGPRNSGCAGTVATRPYQIRPGARPAPKSNGRPGGETKNPAGKESPRELTDQIAVTAGANRSKGARSPEEWMPPNEGYWCEYAQDWAEIKARWELTMTEPEPEAEAVVGCWGRARRQ